MIHVGLGRFAGPEPIPFLPTSIKKFRQSPEIEGFYRFVYENDLQREAFDILEKIVQRRKALKVKAKPVKAAKGK